MNDEFLVTRQRLERTERTVKDLVERFDGFIETHPWAFRETPGQHVAVRALFPRSTVGNYQDDPLMRALIWANKNASRAKISAIEVLKWISDEPEPPFDLFRSYLETLQPSATEFFQGVAERLKYLETYSPAAGDFAIEALQNAFVGLMYGEYEWGKKGCPTLGEVTGMAKALLEQEERPVRKSGWTELLKTAGLGWLPKGAAGRPSKAKLDENVKAQREYKALCTQAVKDVYGGDFIRARDTLKAAYGNKSEYQRSERDLLDLPPTAG